MSDEKTKTAKDKMRELLYSRKRKSILFNRFLLAVNIIAIFLFALDPAFDHNIVVRVLELLFGVFFLVEYGIYFWLARSKLAFAFNLMSLVDLIVVVSLFAPLLLGNFAFLRVIRSLRILRSYRVLTSLSKKRGWFQLHEDLILAVINLFVFIFIMTDIVYVTQVEENETINSYIDALYFTLTTLTTTGFGDITLHGTTGRVLAILIMVFGITLFVKLARAVIRPQKVLYTCPDCGLNRHDPDASHCKHCGRVIKIETEGV